MFNNWDKIGTKKMSLKFGFFKLVLVYMHFLISSAFLPFFFFILGTSFQP